MTTSPTLLPKIGKHWPGTINEFCGILPSRDDGAPDYALLLVAVLIEMQTWEELMAFVQQWPHYALANLAELAVMRVTRLGLFEPVWHWSGEQDPYHPTLARGQCMATGMQDIEHVSLQGHGVLVQRVPLVPAPAALMPPELPAADALLLF